MRRHLLRARSDDRPSDDGTGLLSSLAGVTMFVGFLFLSVQVLVGLTATSAVTANGYAAARDVAADQRGQHGAPSAERLARAEQVARRRLGRLATRVAFDWTGTDGDTVRLRLTADLPRLLMFGRGALGSSHLDRRIVVRVERFR